MAARKKKTKNKTAAASGTGKGADSGSQSGGAPVDTGVQVEAQVDAKSIVAELLPALGKMMDQKIEEALAHRPDVVEPPLLDTADPTPPVIVPYVQTQPVPGVVPTTTTVPDEPVPAYIKLVETRSYTWKGKRFYRWIDNDGSPAIYTLNQADAQQLVMGGSFQYVPVQEVQMHLDRGLPIGEPGDTMRGKKLVAPQHQAMVDAAASTLSPGVDPAAAVHMVKQAEVGRASSCRTRPCSPAP